MASYFCLINPIRELFVMIDLPVRRFRLCNSFSFDHAILYGKSVVKSLLIGIHLALGTSLAIPASGLHHIILSNIPKKGSVVNSERWKKNRTAIDRI